MNSKRTVQLAAALSERLGSYCARGRAASIAVLRQDHEGRDWHFNPAMEVHEQSG